MIGSIVVISLRIEWMGQKKSTLFVYHQHGEQTQKVTKVHELRFGESLATTATPEDISRWQVDGFVLALIQQSPRGAFSVPQYVWWPNVLDHPNHFSRVQTIP